MYRRDYLQRMLEDFSRVLAQAMGLKNLNKNSEALDEIRDAYKTFFGLDYHELEKISREDFVKTISQNPDFKKEHLESIARALMAEGDLYSLDPEKSFDKKSKALSLFRHLEIMDAGTFSIARKEAIRRLKEELES
jgi:hypothetical protein